MSVQRFSLLNKTDSTYTYDHNGNRLTQTSNGAQSQSFTYDAHDKLTSGTGETDGYDTNGNQTSIAIGSNTSTRTFDDEDRLTSITVSGGVTNTFTYNGLGLRVGKVDSTGLSENWDGRRRCVTAEKFGGALSFRRRRTALFVCYT